MMQRQNTPAALIRLRPTAAADLSTLFEIQSDPESNVMAGTKPRTRDVFFATWAQHFANPSINGQVMEIEGLNRHEIVGSIACFQADGLDCVGYWIAKTHWGKGIASRALELFLLQEHRRPLHATTASSNATSQHILTRCGFQRMGLRMGEETERFLAREIVDFLLT